MKSYKFHNSEDFVGMAYLRLKQYELIMKIFNPIFAIFVLLFFAKEFSLLFEWNLFVDAFPDWIFLIIFLVYAICYISPMFRPELVDGYELPTFKDDEENTRELSDEEKELKELERISL